MNKRKNIFILILLILILFSIDYSWMNSFAVKTPNIEEEKVQRVIDGDTIIARNNTIRMLGINTPEKGEKYYNEAKKFLESLIINKTIELEKGKENRDKYNRFLRYVFIENKNINLELIKNGLANPYFPAGEDKYSEKFYEEWNNCLNKNINLCEKSDNECTDCIELNKLDTEKDNVILYNKCNFECSIENWEIKPEGRQKTILKGSINKKAYFETTTKNSWTKTGDSFFLRDDEGGLVLYYHY